MKRILLILIIILFTTSCEKKRESLKEKKIFNLKIGYGENDIGILFNDDINGQNEINTFYRNGFFYISDESNNKIIKITEKGIPVLLIFNPANNPNLKSSITNTETTTDNADKVAFVKLYKAYDIFSPGKITVDINKNIYVVNNNPENKKINDQGSIVNSQIVKFDNKGNYKYTIGKDGIDTIPFGYIYKIVTDQNNNLIVIEKKSNGYMIYKFNNNGLLLKSLTILNKDIPKTKSEIDDPGNYSINIDIIDIIPGFIENNIYFFCQYIKEIEKETKRHSLKSYEILYEKVLNYSLETNKILKLLISLKPETLDISKLKNKSNLEELYGKKNEIVKPPKNLIGVDITGNMYFSQMELPLELMTNEKQSLIVYDKNAKIINSILIEYPINIEYISNFILSPDGKIFYYYIIDGVIQFVSISE